MSVLNLSNKKYERVVFSEVVIPERPNVYGDIMTKEEVKNFAYGFAKAGFGQGVGVDVNHDNVDVSSRVKIVESFIAREGDPDFIPGSWVVGTWIGDDELWQQIIDGDLNGYSYEAVMNTLPIEMEVPEVRYVVGETEPDLQDGHTHKFLVVLDLEGRVLSGMTDDNDYHSHIITTHSVTDMADGHKHRIVLFE